MIFVLLAPSSSFEPKTNRDLKTKQFNSAKFKRSKKNISRLTMCASPALVFLSFASASLLVT